MRSKNAAGKHASRWMIFQTPLEACTIVLPVAQAMVHAPGSISLALAVATRGVGLGVLVAAVLVFLQAKRELGSGLVASPMPVYGATLHTDGLYSHVRHPVYAAILAGACGWALLWLSLPGIALTVLCLVFFLAKIRYEEQLLQARFPHYAQYRRTVPALLPFIQRR